MLQLAKPILKPSSTRLVLALASPAARTTPLSVQLNVRGTPARHPLWTASPPCPLGRLGGFPFSTKPVPPTSVDREHERKLAEKKIEGPQNVSSTSTIRPIMESDPETKTAEEDQEDVMRGIKSDLNTVADTFSLRSVPKEPFALGLAGTLPYLATSLSTIYLSWSLGTGGPGRSGTSHVLIIPHDTAQHWLNLLEPIQLGYGAVLISFLGAIHWGLEWAEKSPSQPRTNFRYAVGLLAPVLAWPTLLLPVEWALISQFLAFTVLYAADSRATTRGWAPPWYGIYRFVLTAVVGVAIFVSLVGRTRVGVESGGVETKRLKESMDKPAMNAEPYAKWAKAEQEEIEKAKKQKEEEEKRRKQEEEKKKKAEGGKNEKTEGKGEETAGEGKKKEQE